MYAAGSVYVQSSNGHIWTCFGTTWFDDSAAGAGVPSGFTGFVTSGTCPTGYAQVTALDAGMPEGTLAAHGDVGGTGGANSITPTVATLTAAAQTFTGSSATTSSVSGGTPAGTVSTPTFTGTPFTSVINHTHTITVTSLVQGGTTAATTGTHVMTSTATGGSARAITAGDSITATSANPSGGVTSITPAGTVSTPTFTGSALAGHTHTLTATGTNSTSVVTGTLNSFDNRPAYVKVIYCQKS
jgi:hypothetical protein